MKNREIPGEDGQEATHGGRRVHSHTSFPMFPLANKSARDNLFGLLKQEPAAKPFARLARNPEPYMRPGILTWSRDKVAATDSMQRNTFPIQETPPNKAWPNLRASNEVPAMRDAHRAVASQTDWTHEWPRIPGAASLTVRVRDLVQSGRGQIVPSAAYSILQR